MFERRLRVFLALLFLGALVLAARAAQVQVGQGDEWRERAAGMAERVAFIAPERGKILDVRGVVLAEDVPAFEACVNYRAIPPDGPDAKWLEDEAGRRARKLPAWRDADKAARAALIAQEALGVRRDLDALWDLLAKSSNQDRAAIDAIRRDIADEVREKHDAYWQSRYRKATATFEALPPQPWYERWVSGQRTPPTPEAFQDDPIGEQVAFHPILGDVSQAVYIDLKLAQERLPQYRPSGGSSWRSVLELRPAVRRRYPHGDVACHVIGTVGPVSREDRALDPNKSDPQRRYALVDRIGREGLEKLAEPQLRGTRGQRRTDRGGGHLSTEESRPGQTVRTTIDVALQAEIQRAFERVDFIGPFNAQDRVHHRDADKVQIPMNGAAVVIDVATGEVRALVSVPTYDLNQFDELYPLLVADDLNRPLNNRALVDEREPGSTAKPIIGLGAVTQRLIGASDRIECLGNPIIDGKAQSRPRCWTVSIYGPQHVHHDVPWNAQHPTGHLDLTDAIERSCNVYFVTEGDKLGVEGISEWMRRFGYGQTTGVGLPENAGLVPAMRRIRAGDRRSAAWYASIGQGLVAATPIQVANEMAAIARDGVWMRPRLVPSGSPVRLPTTRPDGSTIDERRDLQLDRAALAAVQVGMERVVNSDAGTGTKVRNDELGVRIAAKTGSATASPMTRYVRDENGKLVTQVIPYGSRDHPNPEVPWYRMSDIDDAGKPRGTHSWVGGYAPADNPTVAFAVYVEYGSSGGVAAGSVVKRLIAACVKQGYVPSTSIPASPTPRAADEPTMTEEPAGGAPAAAE